MKHQDNILHALATYRKAIDEHDWALFPAFQRVWSERLEMHYFLRQDKLQTTGFSIGITHERRRFRTTILVFKTTLHRPEDIFYAVVLDGTTTDIELGFLLMRVYNFTAMEAKAHAGFTWTRCDAFAPILNRMCTTLYRYALPWLDESVHGDI